MAWLRTFGRALESIIATRLVLFTYLPDASADLNKLNPMHRPSSMLAPCTPVHRGALYEPRCDAPADLRPRASGKDRAVDRSTARAVFPAERERVETSFQLYEKMT